jgi:hypothetical protein
VAEDYGPPPGATHYDAPEKGQDFVSRVQERMNSVFDGVEERVKKMTGLVPHAFGEEKVTPQEDLDFWDNTIELHPDPKGAFVRYMQEIEAQGVPREVALTKGWEFARRSYARKKKQAEG